MKPSDFTRKVTIVSVGIALLLWFSATPAAPAQAGFVRVNNATPFRVTIYVRKLDYYGRRSWRPIGQIRAMSSIMFPQVPAGAWLGAQTSDRSFQWPPFKVVYRGAIPVYEYTLLP